MRRRPIALEPRTIQFIDRQKPALAAGRYTIDGEHVVETSPAKKYSAQQKLLVQAARFTPFGDDVVQSFFPPRGSSGQFQNDLPQIVLNDPTLPWQRALPGGGADTPWLALLLFEREEILSSPDSATGIASLKLSQALGTPESGVYGPQNLTLEE